MLSDLFIDYATTEVAMPSQVQSHVMLMDCIIMEHAGSGVAWQGLSKQISNARNNEINKYVYTYI